MDDIDTRLNQLEKYNGHTLKKANKVLMVIDVVYKAGMTLGMAYLLYKLGL